MATAAPLSSRMHSARGCAHTTSQCHPRATPQHKHKATQGHTPSHNHSAIHRHSPRGLHDPVPRGGTTKASMEAQPKRSTAGQYTEEMRLKQQRHYNMRHAGRRNAATRSHTLARYAKGMKLKAAQLHRFYVHSAPALMCGTPQRVQTAPAAAAASGQEGSDAGWGPPL